ncbi:MAG: protein translocase subunit SecF [Chloroflexota bacterium]
MTIDFVARRWVFYALSLLIILPGTLSLVLPGGVRPGIDFTSGTIMLLRFDRAVTQPELRDAFAEMGHAEAIVQASDAGTWIVRTLAFAQDISESVATQSQTERQVVEQGLRQRFAQVEILGVDHVSPIIASEIVQYAILAVIGACVGILLYLWWAFRRVPHPVRYGACAVAALVHDALLVLGVFSILGRFTSIELDAMFITAVLTVIGFSVHDTIVVFDRIRENIVRHAGESFGDVVNHSLTQTLARSLNTSITVLLTLVTLRLFGGVTIHNFVLALLVGIVSGTYSSIFNASLLLYSWEAGELKALWSRLTGGTPARAAGAA